MYSNDDTIFHRGKLRVRADALRPGDLVDLAGDVHADGMGCEHGREHSEHPEFYDYFEEVASVKLLPADRDRPDWDLCPELPSIAMVTFESGFRRVFPEDWTLPVDETQERFAQSMEAA